MTGFLMMLGAIAAIFGGIGTHVKNEKIGKFFRGFSVFMCLAVGLLAGITGGPFLGVIAFGVSLLCKDVWMLWTDAIIYGDIPECLDQRFGAGLVLSIVAITIGVIAIVLTVPVNWVLDILHSMKGGQL